MWYQWLIFGLVAVLIPFGLYELKDWSSKGKNITDEQNKIANVRMVIYTLFYWLCDLFYMTFILDSLVSRFILGGLIMIIVFCNLSKAFTNDSEANKNPVIRFGLVQDFLVGVALSVYLIYIIPNDELKNIITAVIAAVYGGLLTLVGVAWTIKNGYKEKQEEERKKARPLFTFNNIFQRPLLEPGVKCNFANDMLNNNYKCEIYFEIENSNQSTFKINRVFHDYNWYDMQNITVVLPGGKVIVSYLFELFENMYIEIEDAFQGKYYYKISVVLNDLKNLNNPEELFFTVCGMQEIAVEKMNDNIKNKRRDDE